MSNCGRLSNADERKCLNRAKRSVLRQHPWAGYWLATTDLPNIEYVWSIRDQENRRLLVTGYFNQHTEVVFIAMKYGIWAAKYTLSHECVHWLYWGMAHGRRQFNAHRADSKLDRRPPRERMTWEPVAEQELQELNAKPWRVHYSRR